MTVTRMDKVGIVVEDIDAAIEFSTELGLERLCAAFPFIGHSAPERGKEPCVAHEKTA